MLCYNFVVVFMITCVVKSFLWQVSSAVCLLPILDFQIISNSATDFLMKSPRRNAVVDIAKLCSAFCLDSLICGKWPSEQSHEQSQASDHL